MLVIQGDANGPGMNADLLRNWLNLGEKRWPPDPHVLLGIDPEEKDVARIEQQVHDRLSKLRSYQVSHPEEATEGMNCLAQAFILVTDSLSRQMCQKAMPVTVAVARLPGAQKRLSSPEPVQRPSARVETTVNGKTEVDWRQAPPPVRASDIQGKQSTLHDTLNTSVASLSETVSDIPPVPVQTIVEPDPVAAAAALERLTCELARGAECRRKLTTLSRLLERIAQTRSLARAWKKVARYVQNPQKCISKPAEETDLARRMDLLFEVMEDYPGFFGRPGKPGYRVVAMARLEKTAHMFKILDLHQREELARDWEAGDKLLREHRRFLLESLKAWKRRGRMARFFSDLSDFVHAHYLAVGLTCVTVVVAAVLVLTLL